MSAACLVASGHCLVPACTEYSNWIRTNANSSSSEGTSAGGDPVASVNLRTVNGDWPFGVLLPGGVPGASTGSCRWNQ